MEKKEIFGAIESLAFVSGEPIGFAELQRVFDLSEAEVKQVLNEMLESMTAEGRGVIPFITDKTVQLVTNPAYNSCIVKLLAPPEERNMSDSMMETLSVIAYRQPVTRADIEAVRGVRCEYSVSQLLKQGLICELGRKDCVGRPMLFGTTDAFLRKFGLHSIDELPPMPIAEEEEAAEISVV
ncbi:MAG: SMC-Scp complex subunit ScpB [Clostridia bacterium]|nr:SMC-Scp complex subunit ScpB [Clostridia bacterium]